MRAREYAKTKNAGKKDSGMTARRNEDLPLLQVLPSSLELDDNQKRTAAKQKEESRARVEVEDFVRTIETTMKMRSCSAQERYSLVVRKEGNNRVD